MNMIIMNITPDKRGFSRLKEESMSNGFNMLRRLEDNWLNGQNRFDKPGENLLGFYADGLLIGVCGLNQDPYMASVRAGRLRHLYVGVKWRRRQVGKILLREILEGSGRWFDFINTNAPPSAFAFYERAGFITLADNSTVTHRLYIKDT
ncbi:GNAT family N-acetyltransferase [Rouxiella chamberiensis]|uniref:GNAT family N-acetyltransferase n=1 Tax=Rouxiella chamberiensis TaxID=1513468 RepID=UPI0005D2E02A|nr:GNAT family N-acetyltransferase [Rouxiella chamberiensis]